MSTIARVEQVPADAPVGAVYELVGKVVEVTKPGVLFHACGRCGGTGVIPHFFHVFDGECFDCHRRKGTWRTIADENKLARNRNSAAARREAKRVAKLAEIDRKVGEVLAAHPAIAEAMTLKAEIEAAANAADEYPEYGALGRAVGFVSDLYRFGDLFPWKVEAIEQAVATYRAEAEAKAAEAARVAELPAAPLGKGIEVVGEVVNLRGQESVHNGREVWTPKMLVVTDAGWKVYVTEPRSIEPSKGDRVAFVAELTEGRDGDPQFRIGKRPTKARILTPA